MSNALVPVVHARGGLVFTTSRNVAEVFGKEHRRVLQDIRDICTDPCISRCWFMPIVLFDAYGRQQPAYDITRDGLALLVMGYTGPKAMGFKVGPAYMSRHP